MDTATRARELALLGIEMRLTQSENTGTGSGYKPPHVASGPKGGQFTSTSGGGSGAFSGQYQSGPKPGKGKSARKPATGAGTPQPPAAPRTMKPGDSGEDVRYAQYAMNLLGFKVPQDGNYDQATADAVKQMQARLGMKKPNGHLSSAQLHKLQDAVRLSPCIGAGQRDLVFEAEWEQRDVDPDEEPDEEADEDGSIADEEGDDLADDETDALIQAMDAYTASADAGARARELALLGIDSRAHDVSGELRIPGGKGGGRWTKSPVTAAIAHALEEWGKGNGPDDPFQLDDKPIDREPLRKAAVARGITLKRGASRDDIVKALLDDVRQAKAGGEKKPTRADVTFSLHRRGPNGEPITAVVYQNSKGELSLRRETVPGHPDSQPITTAPDLAAFEKWADDNSEPGLAKWARGEIDKTAPKTPAKKATPRKATAESVAKNLEGFAPAAAPKSAGFDAADLADEIHQKQYSRQEILDRTSGLNAAQLKKLATATSVQLPKDFKKTEAGPVIATPRKLTTAQLREHIADSIARDRHLLANDTAGVKKVIRFEDASPKPLPATKADPLASLPAGLKPGSLVPPGEHIPESVSELPTVPHTRVEAGDFAVWQAPGESPLYGRVVDEGPRRKFVDWQGGRREPLTSAKSPNVTFHREQSASPLAGLEGLTTVQKRAALRKRGLSKAEIDALAPLEKRTRTNAARMLELLGVTRALGHDVTPGHDELHHYWVATPEGLAKWADSPRPWTTLVAHLTKYVGPLKARVYASRWFIEHFGFAAGSDKNRVLHGQPPRGRRVGPG